MSKSSLYEAQTPLLLLDCVFRILMGRWVFYSTSTHLARYFPTVCVFFNLIVARLLLPVTAARSAPLSDSDADQRALGRPGAGGEIRASKIPHALCLEVRADKLSLHVWTITQREAELWHDAKSGRVHQVLFHLPFCIVSPASRF